MLISGLIGMTVGCLQSNEGNTHAVPKVLKYKDKLYGATWGVLSEEEIPYLIKIGEINNIEVFKHKGDPEKTPKEIYPLIENKYVIYVREDMLTEQTGKTFEELFGYKEEEAIPEVK